MPSHPPVVSRENSNGAIRRSTYRTTSWDKHIGLGSSAENPLISRQNSVANINKKSSTSCLQTVKDYCSTSSVHGIKFITVDNIHILERIIWFAVCVVSLSAAILLIQPVFKRYANNQLMMAVESTNTPIWDVDFPAVTICNVNNVMEDLFRNIINQEPWNNNPEMGNVIKLLTGIGQTKINKQQNDNKEMEDVINKNVNAIEGLMKEVTQPIDRMALSCYWLSEKRNCSDLFEKRRTDEGFCWSFNSKAMKDANKNPQRIQDESIESVNASDDSGDGSDTSHEDMIANENETSKIRRVNGAGPMMGLSVLLNPDSKNAANSSSFFTGFKVLIHDPDAFPSMTSRSFLVSAGREVFTAVSPTVVYGTEAVQQLNKKDRFCNFKYEKKMEFYRTYHYDNCLLECKIKAMKKKCGCVPYIFSVIGNVCNYTGMVCITNYQRFFSSVQPDKYVKGLNISVKSMTLCKCRPTCNDVKYTSEVTAAVYPSKPEDITSVSDESIDKSELVLLRVFFKEMAFITYRTDLVYKWTDILSTFGGVVNLFLGCSFISVLEVFYYFVIKPSFRACKRSRSAQVQ